MNLKWAALTATGVCLSAVPLTQAQLTENLDFQFNSAEVLAGLSSATATPTSATTSNPLGVPVSASITYGPTGTGYYPNFAFNDNANYGNRKGLFDTVGGQYQLTLNAQPATPSTSLAYTVTIDQIISADGFFYPGPLILSPGTAGSPVITPAETVNAGQWKQYTYNWNVAPGSGPLTLTITPDPLGGGGMMFDRLQWKVVGDLTAVPEPGMAAVATAAGLGAFAMLRLRRRQA